MGFNYKFNKPCNNSLANEIKIITETYKIPCVTALIIYDLANNNSHLRKLASSALQKNKSVQDSMEMALNDITLTLKENNVTSMLIKGLDFAHRLYKHPNERTCGDIDLVVASQDYEKARDIIKRCNYKEELASHPYFDNLKVKMCADVHRTRKYEWRKRCLRDPCYLITFRKYPENKWIVIELHQSKFFQGLDIDKIISKSLNNNTKNNGKNYLVPEDLDLILISAWHFYRDTMNLVPNESIITKKDIVFKQDIGDIFHNIEKIGLRHITDIWNALNIYFFSNKIIESDIINRAKEINAVGFLCVSIARLIELLKLIDEYPPVSIITLYKRLKKESRSLNIDRLLENQWKYGNYRSTFWNYYLDPITEQARIKKECKNIHHDNGTYYYAFHKYHDHSGKYIHIGSTYQWGMDRLYDNIEQGHESKNNIPSFSWKMSWNVIGLFFEIQIKTNNIVVGPCIEAPILVDKVQLSFSTNNLTSNVEHFEIQWDSLSKNLKIFSRKYDFLNDTFWFMNKIDEEKYKLNGLIPSHYLPFKLYRNNQFTFKIRYYDYLEPSVENTVLVWPYAFFEAGKVFLV